MVDVDSSWLLDKIRFLSQLWLNLDFIWNYGIFFGRSPLPQKKVLIDKHLLELIFPQSLERQTTATLVQTRRIISRSSNNY